MAAIKNFQFKSAEEANRKALVKRKVLAYNCEANDAQARKAESQKSAIAARRIELGKIKVKVLILR